MHWTRRAAIVVVVAPLLACSSDPTQEELTAELRRAAERNFDALRTGTIAEILELQSSSCLTGEPVTAEGEAELQAFRNELEDFLGVPLDEIAVTGVDVRDVTATSGEAEVRYDLPDSVAGNDNWVTFERREGEWKVSNCHPPIGGFSDSDTEPALPGDSGIEDGE